MVEVEVLTKNLAANRLNEESKEDADVFFDVRAVIAETAREAGKLTLKFTIRMETQPSLVNLVIEGTAVVRGEEHDIDSLLVSKDKDDTPAVFMKIYQKVYAVLYLLCSSLRVPYPSPTLLRSVEVLTQAPTTSNASTPKTGDQSAQNSQV
ncbi:MAG: hypothetical protein QW767_01820 [Thermoprotei archaeon]